jgi:hypothetical protein
MNINVSINKLLTTEDFLEKDKLAIVLLKVFKEGYHISIIVTELNKDFFILS